MNTPVIPIIAVGSATPVRGHSACHFSKSVKAVQTPGRCVGTRKNHAWLNGRCWWCGKPRNAK